MFAGVSSNCIHKHAIGCLKSDISVCCWCVQQHSSTPTGQVLLSINNGCRQDTPAGYFACGYCWKCWEYWSLRGFPSQVNRLIGLNSPNLPGSPVYTPGSSLIASAPFSPIHHRGSIKSRHETIDTVRGDLQVLREEIASTLANLQTLSETLLAANMEGTATRPSGPYAEDPMVGSSRMAMPEVHGQATPGTSIASANSGQSNPLLQPFQNPALDSLPPSPNYSFPRRNSPLQPPTEFLEQWQRLVRREAIRRGFEIRMQEPAGYAYTRNSDNPNMLGTRSPLEWRGNRWVRVEPRSPEPRSPRLDNMGDGRPEAKEISDMTLNLECKICMSQLVDTVMIPCGHAVLCRWCAELHVPPSEMDPTRPVEKTRCPICRRHVERKYRIYLT